MPKQLLVTQASGKPFKVMVPDGCRITFGPWSPPTGTEKYAPSNNALGGTLRIYSGPTKTSEDVIAVFSGVTGFRDMSLEYTEQVVIEEGATIWKSDANGYERESKVKSKKEWTPLEPAALEGPAGEDVF